MDESTLMKRVRGQISEMVTEAGKLSGLSQRGMAVRARCCQMTVSNMLNGIGTPSIPSLAKFCAAFGWHVDLIFTPTEGEPPFVCRTMGGDHDRTLAQIAAFVREVIKRRNTSMDELAAMSNCGPNTVHCAAVQSRHIGFPSLVRLCDTVGWSVRVDFTPPRQRPAMLAPGTTLEELAREATDEGLTYGQYMARFYPVTVGSKGG